MLAGYAWGSCSFITIPVPWEWSRFQDVTRQNRNSWSRGKMAIASDGYKALIVLSCVMWVVSIMLFSSIPSHNDNGALPTQVFPASASAHA